MKRLLFSLMFGLLGAYSPVIAGGMLFGIVALCVVVSVGLLLFVRPWRSL